MRGPRLEQGMATSSVKREAPPPQDMSDDDDADRRKRFKNEEESTDSSSDDPSGQKIKKSDSKSKSKRNSDSHPHKCSYPDCERAYTRAEHLHRHQLEHTRDPKFYKCRYADCDFGCVRKDLIDRHHDRHTKEGSNLWRRDQKVKKGKGNQRLRAATGGRQSRQDGPSSPDRQSDNIPEVGYRLNGSSGHSGVMPQHSPTINTDYVSDHQMATISPTSPLGYPTQPMGQPQNPGMNGYGSPTGMTMPPLANAFYPPASSAASGYYVAPRPRGPSQSALPNFDQTGMMGGPNQAMGMGPLDPMFGASGVDASLAQQTTDLSMNLDAGFEVDETLWMLDDPSLYNWNLSYVGESGTRSVADPEKARRQREIYGGLADLEINHVPDGASETSHEGQLPTPSRATTPVHIMMGPNMFTKAKYNEIYDFIERKFEDVPHPKKIRRREGETSVFDGVHFDKKSGKLNTATKQHLSHNNLNEYLTSYWREYASQIPIVHPSLDTNHHKTECLLLLAMIAIGASSLNSPSESEIASFLAWNVRTRVQNHSDLVCPTETWILQTLVLVEAFEKLFSTRLLHERSHQLHGLTIELARRSECFEGPDAITVDPTALEPSWREFIEMESRKRVAYTVFMTDIFHACMFSHKAMVKFQEVELALPCIDTLWDCRDPSSFYKAFVSPDNEMKGHIRTQRLPSFQSVLKKLAENSTGREFEKALHNADLQQNTFAFKAVLAGFISVHREIDKLSSRKNCLTLLRNLENWVKRSRAVGDQQAEQFTELFSISALAQINTRSSVVYLQQIACPNRILGKQVNNVRRNEALKQIRRWVRNDLYKDSLQNASGAACAAARFLVHIFSQRDRDNGRVLSIEHYDPRGDHFLHRPWAVYVAVLCIWAFAYTREGPIKREHVVEFRRRQGQHEALDPAAVVAANRYLERLAKLDSAGAVQATVELNRCLGLLAILADRFHGCQWELLREAGDRLEDCARILKGQARPVDDWVWIPVTKATVEEKLEAERENREMEARIRKQLDENNKYGARVLNRLEKRSMGQRGTSGIGSGQQGSRSSSQGLSRREESTGALSDRR